MPYRAESGSYAQKNVRLSFCGDPLKAEKSPFGPFFDENGSANAQLGIQKPLIEELLKA